ncbi:MAG: TonB-dependent receptor [Bacteroidota bacterium]|nr:TonB-dependent receptor [Bacteroidota bacterium]
MCKKMTLTLFVVVQLLLLSVHTFAQTKTIRGKITDDKGGAIEGASVIIKGGQAGTSTDKTGHFVINAKENAILVVSFVGFESKEFRLSSSSLKDLVIQLSPAVKDLDQIVVVGYGSVRKKDVTGSVASLSGAKLNEVPGVDVSRAMQGRIAGVEMAQSSTKPGTGMQIRIRGTRSLNASNDPLVVLDGIPFSGSLSDIDPNDIKSIDVLKDASATAIYGSRGANGVILVTTNKGQVGQRAHLTYSGYTGMKKVFAKYPMMNGPEFAALRKAAAANGTVYNNTIDENDSTNTDWQDLLYRTGYVTNHNLNIAGGSEKGNYSVSLGYFKDQAVIPLQNYERYSIRTTLEQRIGNGFRFGLTTNANYATTHDNNLGPGTPMGYSPLLNPYNPDGSLKRSVIQNTSGAQWVYTRQTLEGLGDQYIDLNRAFSSYNSLYVEAKIPGVDGLKYRMNVGMNFRQNNYGSYTGQGVFNGSNPTAVSSANISNNQNTNWTIENLLTYDKVFAHKHRINAVGLFSSSQNTYWNSSASAQDIPADAFQFYNLGRANVTPIISPGGQGYYQSGLLSWMGRVMYSFNDKYYVTATFRSDASSVLAPGHQWHNYPAINAAWNMKDDVFKNVKIVDAVKLRVGYGETSNQAINPYQTLGLLSTVPYNFGSTYSTGMYVTQLPNPSLGWEFSKNWNVGADFSMFKNRLNGTLEYYIQNTDNVLLSQGLPTTSGVNSVTKNIGATQNRGVELSLNGVIFSNKDWTWEAGVNIYANKNKLVSLASGQVKDEGNQWFVGHGIDVIFDYKKIGLWSSAADSAQHYQNVLEPGTKVGLIKVLYTGPYDANGKPTRQINADDRQVTDIQPNFEGGFNTRVSYKAFDLNVTGFFRSGGYMISTLYGSAGYLDNLNSRSGGNVKVDYWKKDGDNTFAPRPGGAGGDNPKYGSTLGYFKSSFTKIRTITIGYTFNQQKMLKSAGVERMRVYATVENPFVFFSPYTAQSGMDPETNSHATENTAVSAGPYRLLTVGANTPSTRNFLIGLNVTF